MLRQRLITAGILAPLVMAGIWFLPTYLFALAVGIVGLMAAFELTGLAQLRKPAAKVIYLLLLAIVSLLSCQLMACAMNVWLQAGIALWWLIVTAYLIITREKIKESRKTCCWVLVSGGLIIVLAWLSMVHIHHNDSDGPALILFLFFLTWGVDSSAFFTGKFWKKISPSPTPLSPTISPKKTWAGVFGSVLIASLFGVLLWLSGWVEASLVGCILLCVVVAYAAVGGDLWESMVKRRVGAKDSGDLLPGHGGMLDRVDSKLASAPVFAFGINLLEMMNL